MKARTRIITSLLDNDFYNFTMGQLIWKNFPGVHVTYGFICRTHSAKLGRLIDVRELNAELAAVRRLKLDGGEQAYLRSLGMLSAEYVEFLAHIEMPEVIAHRVGDDLKIEYTGLWSAAIFWETPILAIISELATRKLARGHEDEVWTEAAKRTTDKLNLQAQHPGVKIVEFATRRRATKEHQRATLIEVMRAIPKQLLGTSNVALARELGLVPSGTMAHQLMMVITALKDDAGNPHPIAAAQKQVLDLYEEMYADFEGGRLLTFLPDTFGTEVALALFEPERARLWHGFRQDSGDPFVIGELILDFWERLGIDPKTKTIMFSDGLDVPTMIRLYERFGERTNVLFGLGTNLANDTGIPPLSIVVKPICLVVGDRIIMIVKLSDNLAKATGDPAMIERRKAEAGYHVTFNLATVY